MAFILTLSQWKRKHKKPAKLLLPHILGIILILGGGYHYEQYLMMKGKKFGDYEINTHSVINQQILMSYKQINSFSVNRKNTSSIKVEVFCFCLVC